jgi:hypothetical protein
MLKINKLEVTEAEVKPEPEPEVIYIIKEIIK